MEERIKKVIGKLFNMDISNWSIEDINTENIKEWDSLSHLKLIIALEQEFNIDISPEDILKVKKGGMNIVDVINRKE